MVITTQKRAFGVFSNREEAEQALNELKDSGFSMDKVSILAKQAEENDRLANAEISDRVGEQYIETPAGVAADAATGATWGTILVGLSSLALPGLGAIIAAGSIGVALVTTLAGIGLGTVATGRLVSALSDLGIPEEQARVYSDRLLAGDYLLIIEGTQEEIQNAEDFLSDRGVEDWFIPTTAAS